MWKAKDIVLDDRWTVTVNDKVYKDVTLSKFRFDMCDRGDILTFEHVIPRYDTTDDPTINLYSIHATVKVSVDNEVIYQYGQDRYQEKKDAWIWQGILFHLGKTRWVKIDYRNAYI